MRRREFIGAIAAAGLLPSRRAGAAPFPVRFAKPNPFDAVLRFTEPGSDEFAGEKAAAELEARLGRIFAGKEPAPAGLETWISRREQIEANRFYALPGDRVRFEIALKGEYHTGVWQLPDFKAIEHETVAAAQPYFRDVTGQVFGAADSFTKQLIPGNPNWRARLDSACGIDVYGNHGIAVGDIDNDGADEIYVCQPGGLPNRLYKIRPDGRAEDVTERAGVGVLDETTCALFADFRNAGVQDLVVLRSSGPLYFLNNGSGVFEEQPNAFRFGSTPQGSFTGMAVADFDRDGRLDLYLCCYIYFQSEDQYQYPAPYFDARNGPPNFLFRNRSMLEGLLFEDVTLASGINENNDRFSFAPAWCDFDGDGWPDLYVANDFGRNNLYRNRAGRFHDEAAQAGVEDVGPGMSASWFDYDGDGRPDLYVSNMWTAAGQRVTKDPAFAPSKANPEEYRRHTKGNSLYRNKADGTFEETSPREGVEMGRWAWSSGGFDFDLDGAPEILVATGMVTNGTLTNGPKQELESFFWRQVVAKSPVKQTAAPAYENGWNALNQLIREDYSWSGHQPNVFYVRRDGRYRDASGVSGLDAAEDTRTFAVTDFDGDGYPDLLLKSRLGPQVRAMRNDSALGKPAIAISLKGTKSNRDAIGARVEVNGQAQWLSAGSGFLSQHSKRLHFGLAGKPAADVKIVWPSGLVQNLGGLEPGFTYTITEGSEKPARAAFRPRAAVGSGMVAGKNAPEPVDTWLLEPVPLPDRRASGFLILHAGDAPKFPADLPVASVDLRHEKDDVAAAYSLFRRYIFEYRSDLSLPFGILVDSESRARKIYAATPSEATMRADLAHPGNPLPFAGKYYQRPKRNYFKLGAAFYWAGYAERAIPYLAETLRTRPNNWKAMLAIGRIQQELGQNQDALATFRTLLDIKSDYAPAWVNAGEVSAQLRDTDGARRMFSRALDLDPKCADAMNQLGVLSAEANDAMGARKLFQQAIATQRDHSGAINNLGVLYAKTGQVNDAIAAFRYGIGAAPDDEQLYLNLARIYVTIGEREQARAVLNQLMERKPGNALAAKALRELDR
jgi:tetratricopeptide (TPR) repeat protein